MSAPPRRLLLRTGAPAGRSDGSIASATGCSTALALAALLAIVVMVGVVYEVVNGASLAISHFGLGFVTDTKWSVPFEHFGAGVMLYGTLVTSAWRCCWRFR